MPSLQKTLLFISSALATSLSIGILGFGMSLNWGKTTMDCARAGTVLFNGTAEITLGLFDGLLIRTSCPFIGDSDPFDTFQTLKKTAVASLVLHVLVVCLLVLCLLFSACSILISLYNSVSNPYETYMGPAGVYTCSSLSACLSVLVLILFAINISATSMAEELVEVIADTVPVDLKNKSVEMGVGFFLVIPYVVLSLAAISMIFIYEHAAYTHKREQERPTEDAPKEIMMY